MTCYELFVKENIVLALNEKDDITRAFHIGKAKAYLVVAADEYGPEVYHCLNNNLSTAYVNLVHDTCPNAALRSALQAIGEHEARIRDEKEERA